MSRTSMKYLAVCVSIFFVACKGPGKEEKATAVSTEEAKPAIDRGVVIHVQSEPDTLKGSLKAYADANVGGTQIALNYYSPAVRGRMIWGGLVPYDQVWVTGAHKATNVEFQGNVRIGDSTIEAGKYGLFTIPGREKWTIILNKNWDQHLTDEYDEKDDVVRVEVEPVNQSTRQERLRYIIVADDQNRGGRIEIYWDTLMVALPLEVDS